MTDSLVKIWDQDSSSNESVEDLGNKTWLAQKVAREIINEDAVLGADYLKSTSIWVRHTRNLAKTEQSKFSTLKDYLDYRSSDIAREYVIETECFRKTDVYTMTEPSSSAWNLVTTFISRRRKWPPSRVSCVSFANI